MNSKHTPGPWKAYDDDGTGTLPCVLANQPTSFGNFYIGQCNVFEDANLIAAAPELLEALKQVRSIAGDCTIDPLQVIKKIIKIINSDLIEKAEGK